MFFSNSQYLNPMRSMKQYDIIDNGNKTLTLNIAVPGLRKDELKVTFDRHILRIVSAPFSPGNGYKFIEQHIPTDYDYKFTIPDTLRVETAFCEDGVLSVLLVPSEISDSIEVKVK